MFTLEEKTKKGMGERGATMYLLRSFFPEGEGKANSKGTWRLLTLTSQKKDSKTWGGVKWILAGALRRKERVATNIGSVRGRGHKIIHRKIEIAEPDSTLTFKYGELPKQTEGGKGTSKSDGYQGQGQREMFGPLDVGYTVVGQPGRETMTLSRHVCSLLREKIKQTRSYLRLGGGPMPGERKKRGAVEERAASRITSTHLLPMESKEGGEIISP